MSNPSQRIKELTEQLNYHNHLYYQENRTEIPDREFDALLKELEALEEQHPELKEPDSPTQRVGGAVTKEFATITHKYPMLSLGNTYSEEEVTDFDERIRKTLGDEPFEYVCELKFDGVALSVSYQNGVLKHGVTRGDGVRGDDVTTNVKTIRSMPLKNVSGTPLKDFEIRGEVFFPLQEFERVNQEREDIGEAPLANPRNATSGTIKMQDSAIVSSRRLDCFVYGLLGEDLPVESHWEGLELLKKSGFNVSPTSKKCGSLEEVMAYIEEWEHKRFELPVFTDGVVVKINRFDQQKRLGNTSKSPRWAMAYKFEAESAQTLLESISYQVGRTGAVTPVANLKPVHLAGTVVKRASLHNANEIERLDLHLGDTVNVEKGGEIIPKVTSVVLEKRPADSTPVEYISECPECQTPLIRKEGEANHYCPNEQGCAPQIKGRIEHFIQRKAMNIEGLGPETIELLLKEELIKGPVDLYELTYEQLIRLERFAKRSSEKLLDSIQKSIGSASFPQVLFALGIRHVGATGAEKLARHFKSIDALMNANFETLVETPEIGGIIAQSIVDYFTDEQNRAQVERLKTLGIALELSEEETANQSNALEGKSFVVSGVFSQFSRDELKKHIQQNGGRVVSSISGKLDYLVAGDKMGPAKKTKAEKLGVNIISEEEYIQLANNA